MVKLEFGGGATGTATSAVASEDELLDIVGYGSSRLELWPAAGCHRRLSQCDSLLLTLLAGDKKPRRLGSA